MTEPMLTIDVPGLPVPFARSGGHGKVRFTPARQRSAMADLKIMASMQMEGRKPYDFPLSVHFHFQWPFPKSMSPKKRGAMLFSDGIEAGKAYPHRNHWKAGRPDVDNLVKLCADALNGVVWADDKLIVHAVVHKIYGDSARTLISVSHAGTFG